MTSRDHDGATARIRRAGGTFSYLLVALLALFLVTPLLPPGTTQSTGELLALSAVLLTSVHALHGSRRAFFVGIAVVVPAILGRWLSFFAANEILVSASRSFAILLFILTTWNIIRYLMTEREVKPDTLFGAVSAYLLIGLIFGAGYGIVEAVSSGSFANLPADPVSARVVLDYFSLVTLTTLGYGDVTPLSQIARSLVVLEAVIGQFYLAVLVARLVGLFLAGWTSSKI